MGFDTHKNLAVSAVASAPSPASSGTSLTVTAGHGTRFPAVPFNATIWPATAAPDPTNAEVVRVTDVTGDVLTIVRTQESTSARTVVVGDLIAASITAKTFSDIETLSFRTFNWGLAQDADASVGVNVGPELIAPVAGTIFKAWARCKQAPTGASLIFDININGTPASSSKLTITAGNTSGVLTNFTNGAIAENDVLTIDVDQVGSDVHGRYITIQVAYR